jgi:short subunit dehydrogenase-like uncharacterized protein
MAARTTVSVLGATGYTGGLIVRELQRRGIPVLAAGRSAERLRRLAAEVPGLESIEADAGDRPALGRLASRSRVLINTVGPFIDYGEPVVRAAIANGAHYVDTAGEQPFMKAMLAHDEWARQQGVAVVSAQAFEVAVADFAAALAAAEFRDVAAVHITYDTRFHPSQGTQRSVVRMLQSTGYAYVRGKWVEEAPAEVIRVVDFPEPVGRVTAVSFPSAEVITVPRHINTREVRTFITVPPMAARLVSAAVPVVRTLMRSPLSFLAKRFIGTGTAGPDETTRAGDEFRIAVEVRGVRGGRATHRRAFAYGRDPYGLTAVIAAQAAALMSRSDYQRAGVLPPAAAFDAGEFLGYLGNFGVRCEIREGIEGARVPSAP